MPASNVRSFKCPLLGLIVPVCGPGPALQQSGRVNEASGFTRCPKLEIQAQGALPVGSSSCPRFPCEWGKTFGRVRVPFLNIDSPSRFAGIFGLRMAACAVRARACCGKHEVRACYLLRRGA